MDEEWLRYALSDGMPAIWAAETVGWTTPAVRTFARSAGIRVGADWPGVSTKIRDSIRLAPLHREFAPKSAGR